MRKDDYGTEMFDKVQKKKHEERDEESQIMGMIKKIGMELFEKQLKNFKFK